MTLEQIMETTLRVMDEQAQRAAVVAEAKTWLMTPYHHQGRIKGAGVDCAMLLAEVYEAAGVIERVEPEPYPRDWHMHRNEERYLGHVEQFARKVEGPAKPGDIALFRVGRCLSHGGIVIEWPVIIHAYVTAGFVVLEDVERNEFLGKRYAGIWSPWRRA